VRLWEATGVEVVTAFRHSSTPRPVVHVCALTYHIFYLYREVATNSAHNLTVEISRHV
jgi:hypothetical protein